MYFHTLAETYLNFSAFNDGSIQSLKNKISVTAVSERYESETLHETITIPDITSATYRHQDEINKVYQCVLQCTTFSSNK